MLSVPWQNCSDGRESLPTNYKRCIRDTFVPPFKVKKKITKSLATPNFSFRTWTRGLISMYSLTASYRSFRLASLQNSSGTSKTFETRLMSRRSLNKRPVNLSASFRRRRRAPDSASCLGMDKVSGEDNTRCALVS